MNVNLLPMATSVRELPSGTVTFLFTDIEGSTRLLQQLGPRYEELLEQHRRLVRAAVEAGAGCEVNTEGDAFFIVFSSASRAAASAVAAQQALAGFPWPDGAAVRVRMGLHTGEATPVGRDYAGLDVHRAARINSAGHGGQILLSQSTKVLIEHALPAGTSLRDLGEHRLKDLSRAEHIFQLDAPDLQTDFPSLKTLDVTPNNLPIQLTSFIGREREVAEARRLLGSTRLLTLTGPGGTGKTRLSLQVAADVVDQFPNGVFFVPLAPISDPNLVAPTVAQTLGIHESGGRTSLDLVRDYLHDKELLLILDNFEQVLPAAPVVGDLLKATPGLKVVATSRAALRVYGEQELPVLPLRLPDPKHLPGLETLSQYEAVALFIQRAVTVKPDFRVTNENAPAVAEITARLDGLPLAIELAAARVKLLPPQAMLARLERRLSLLGGGSRDLPVRQQTLRDAIAWSYDMLDDGSRRLLARSSVFVGGYTLEDAEMICGPSGELGRDVLDGLSGLVDQSLLRQEEEHGAPRFMMLETIRDFALERLEASGEEDEIRRRHAMVFVALAELAQPHLLGAHQTTWLDRLEREHDNLRAAVAWAIERAQAEVAMRLGAALWRFWQMRGHLHEGRDRLGTILALPGTVEQPKERAKALEAAGGIAYWQADFAAAERLYEESLAIQRQRGSTADIANALYNLAFVFVVPQADINRGRSLLEESLALYTEAGDRASIARAHWALASAYQSLNDYQTARVHLDVSLSILRGIDDRFSLGWSLHLLGLINLKTGDHPGARAAWSEALSLFAEARDVSGIALLLDDLSSLAVAEGMPERAARLAGAASALQTSSGTDLGKVLNAIEGRGRPGESGVDQEAIAAAWEEGRTMSVEAIVAYALGKG